MSGSNSSDGDDDAEVLYTDVLCPCGLVVELQRDSKGRYGRACPACNRYLMGLGERVDSEERRLPLHLPKIVLRPFWEEVAESHLQTERRLQEVLDSMGKDLKGRLPDMVNHPPHYGGADNPYEVIKVIEAWGTNFHIGQVIKYVARAGKKDPSKHVEDLKKARFYLDREIARLEKTE